MRSVYFLVILAILLGSCSSALSGDAIQTAIVQTEMARPTKTFVFTLTDIPTPTPESTSTPTPIPLTDLDLSSILIQPSDLLLGFVGGQVQNVPPEMFDDIPQPVYQIYQQLSQIYKANGGVAVLVYDTATVANNVYNTIEESWPDQSATVPIIGDKSHINFGIEEGVTFMSLLFLRCNAVGFIQLRDLSDSDYIISCAQRLDERLFPLVCR